MYHFSEYKYKDPTTQYLTRAMLLPLEDFISKLEQFDYFNKKKVDQEVFRRKMSYSYAVPLFIIWDRIQDIRTLKEIR